MMKNSILWLLMSISAICSAGNTYYVSPAGSHTSPFNSEATASTNIQSAVDIASSDDVVMVLPGHYVLSLPIAISETIEVVAQSPGTVVVDGNGSIRCFNLADVSCILSGLVISNGVSATGEGGGVYCSGQNPILTNCVVVDCSAPVGGGISGTTAYDCEIRNNDASVFGGGAENAVLFSCSIFNNTAIDEGGGIDWSTAYNCLIHSNTVTGTSFGGGGISYESILVNCTVVNNSSAGGGGGIRGAGSGAIVINSIVSDNVATGLGMNYIGLVSFTNSCCPDITNGVNNITDEPSFLNPSANDYSLSGESPCINAGDNSHVVSSTDLIGNSRIVSGTVDMGAYEFQGEVLDTDNDGMSDADEAIAGTDPNDDTSFFAITNWSTGNFTIEWPAFSGRKYRVYRADSLTNTFNLIGPVIHYPQNSYTDNANSAEDSGFYKVEVQLQ